MNDGWEGDGWEDDESSIPCPECGAELHPDADACPACGYWLTEADRSVAWRARSASGRVVQIGWWMIGVALVGAALIWMS